MTYLAGMMQSCVECLRHAVVSTEMADAEAQSDDRSVFNGLADDFLAPEVGKWSHELWELVVDEDMELVQR